MMVVPSSPSSSAFIVLFVEYDIPLSNKERSIPYHAIVFLKSCEYRKERAVDRLHSLSLRRRRS